MRCRIRHKGRPGSPPVAILGYNIQPGFTSPDMELKEGSPELAVVMDMQDEGLLEILPPENTGGRTQDGPSRAPRGKLFTQEQVRQHSEMRRKVKTGLPVGAAGPLHIPGHPFGIRNTPKQRVFSDEDLPEKQRPKPIEQEELPKTEAVLASKKGMLTEEEVADARSSRYVEKQVPVQVEDEIAELQKEAAGTPVGSTDNVMTADEVPSRRSTLIEDQPVDESEAEETEITEEYLEKATMDLGNHTKAELMETVEKLEIEMPSKINKGPLVQLLVDGFRDKSIDCVVFMDELAVVAGGTGRR